MGKKKKGFSRSQIIGLHYPKGFNVIKFPWWLFFVELFLGAFVTLSVICRLGISNEWIRCLMTFLIYESVFSFCKAIKDSNMTLDDFRIAFEKAAKSHGVKTLI